MKREEIRSGIRSIIQATVAEAQRLEEIPAPPSEPQQDTPKLRGSSIQKKTAQPTKPPRFPKILIKRHGARLRIDIKDSFYPMLNDVSDALAHLQTMPEEIVYNRMYRLSVGWGDLTCRVGYSALLKFTSITSKGAVIRAIQGLREKGHIALVLRDNGEPIATQEGTLYRVFLPCEILGGVSLEGIPLASIPREGILCKSILLNSIPLESIPSKGIPLNNIPTILSKGIPLNNTPDTNPTSLKAQSAGIPFKGIPLNGTNIVHTKNSTKTPSPSDLVRAFYQGIDQLQISTSKEKRALRQLKELQEDGFSLDDIAFTVEWTIANKKNIHSFGIIADTIGEALARRGEYLEVQQNVQQRKLDDERERELQKRVSEIRAELSEEERAELYEEAKEAVENDPEVDTRFPHEYAIRAKEDALILERYVEE